MLFTKKHFFTRLCAEDSTKIKNLEFRVIKFVENL